MCFTFTEMFNLMGSVISFLEQLFSLLFFRDYFAVIMCFQMIYKINLEPYHPLFIFLRVFQFPILVHVFDHLHATANYWNFDPRKGLSFF